MSEEELKPCPFCGSKATVQVIPPHTHKLTKWIPDCNGEVIIECKCGCSIMRDTEEDAIKTWNTRKSVENVVEQLEEKVKLAYRRYMDCPPNSPCFARYRTQYEERKMCLEIVKGGGVDERI